MKKEYVKIDGKEYAETGIATGAFEPVTAVKFARVFARRGIVGEEVISYTQGGLIEKVDKVGRNSDNGEVDWVLTKISENGEVIIDEFGHDNSWIVKYDIFAKKYERDDDLPGCIYKPTGGLQVFVPLVMDATLTQWGLEMNIDAGGWINITNWDDVYGISQRDFQDTYRIVESQDKSKTV